MKNWFKNNRKITNTLLVILVLFALSLTLILVKQSQDQRSSAASPDKLETEGGTLSGNAAVQSDSGASGGQYVSFSTQTSGPTPTPGSTSPPSSSTGTYGPGVNMDSKDNQQIDAVNKWSIKFRATQTSQVNSFRLQWRTGPVYSGTAGNYGLIRITLRTDDGTGKPSNTALASVDVNPNNLPSMGYDASFIRTTSFPSPPSLTKGNLYHLHLENVHSSPTTSYISINSVFIYGSSNRILGRNIPHFDNNDYGLLRFNGGSWTNQNNDTPALDIIYANGGHDGFAYQSVAFSGSNPNYPMPLIGGNNMVREHFTVQDGNKTVTRLWARIGRISGSGNAVLRLENENGSLIEEGPVQGSGSIPIIPLDSAAIGGSLGTWIFYTLTQPRTLINGQTYNLRISAPSGTTYQHTCVISQDSSAINGTHDMKSYAFNEGHGEKSTNGGSTWEYCYGSWYHNSTQTVMEISN